MNRSLLKHPWSSAVPILVASLTFSGCAHFQDKPLNAARVVGQFESRSLSDPGLKSFLEANHAAGDWPRASWDFRQLSLVAFYFNPDLEVARSQLAGVAAAEITAAGRLNPTVSFSGTYDTTTPPPWIPGVSFDLPIETMGKRGYRIAQAAHLSDAARFNLSTVAWQVRGRVRKNLLALYSAGANQSLLQKQEAILADNVTLLERQLQAGAVSPFEVTQSRIALNQTRFALGDAETLAAGARMQLAETLGVPARTLDSTTFEFGIFQEFPRSLPDAALRRQALLARPDIRSALAEYAAAQSALQLEIAKQYPNVHLNPGYQLDQTDNKWTLGLTLELPLLNRNQGPVAEAEAKRTEIAARFRALQSRVLSEIERAVTGYRLALKQADAAQALNRELDQQFRTAQGMFQAGDISRLELAQRQIELTSTALTQQAALVAAQAALGLLEDALQSPAQTGAGTQ